MARGSLLAIMLAVAALGTLDLFGPDGQGIGTVREGPGGRMDVYDAESRRIGWGRRGADGSVEVFDKKGKRIGTGTPDGRVIIQWPPERGRR